MGGHVLVFVATLVLVAGVLHASKADLTLRMQGNTPHHSWETPGCHLVGHNRWVKTPGCQPFWVTTNACRGFCLSYAVPSSSNTLQANPSYVITSRAQCCSITDTHDVPVEVQCINRDRFGESIVNKTMVFQSALSCGCSICRRG